jgi:hypothetical protein
VNVGTQETPSKISGKYEELIRPLIAEGEYPATVKRWQILEIMFGQPKLVINCDVFVDDEILDLAYFCNIKLTPEKTIQPPGRRSNLYKLIQKLLPPDNTSRDLDDLIGLHCTAVVETSMLDDKKELKPVSEQYSVIRKLLPDLEAKPDPWDIQ